MSKIEKIISDLKDIKNNIAIKKTLSDIQRVRDYITKIEMILNEDESILINNHKYNKQQKDQQKKSFNGLCASDWAKLSKNVWNDLSSPRKGDHLVHGATYSEKLANRVISMYSGEKDIVFDPFLGTGTTLVSARNLNRNGIGIELVKKFYNISKKTLMQKDLLSDSDISIHNADCRDLEKYIDDDSIQLTLTSPPYANFIHKTIHDRKTAHKESAIVKKNNSKSKPYSSNKKDFGNLDYNSFLNECLDIFKKIYKKTKKNGYCVWVVKDYRDTKNKVPYINFHTDLSNVAQNSGFKLHDLIVWDQNSQRSLILLGYPSVFYTNQNCSFLVVLRKT